MKMRSRVNASQRIGSYLMIVDEILLMVKQLFSFIFLSKILSFFSYHSLSIFSNISLEASVFNKKIIFW